MGQSTTGWTPNVVTLILHCALYSKIFRIHFYTRTLCLIAISPDLVIYCYSLRSYPFLSAPLSGKKVQLSGQQQIGDSGPICCYPLSCILFSKFPLDSPLSAPLCSTAPHPRPAMHSPQPTLHAVPHFTHQIHFFPTTPHNAIF